MAAPGGVGIDVLHLIDRLEEIIVEARKVPLGSGVMVDRKRLLDLVDELRVAVPEQVVQAVEVVERRDETLQAAQRQASQLMASARGELEARISEQDVLREAQARAQEMVARAEEQARQLSQEAEDRAAAELGRSATAASQQLEEADRYALELLRKLEGQIQAFLDNIRGSIGQIAEKQS